LDSSVTTTVKDKRLDKSKKIGAPGPLEPVRESSSPKSSGGGFWDNIESTPHSFFTAYAASDSGKPRYGPGFPNEGPGSTAEIERDPPVTYLRTPWLGTDAIPKNIEGPLDDDRSVRSKSSSAAPSISSKRSRGAPNDKSNGGRPSRSSQTGL